MIKTFKSVSPLVKISFLISLLLLLIWVIPSMVSYYKNQKLYGKKIDELAALDQRVGAQLDAKPFHSEVFKLDAEESFDHVNVTSIDNNAYQVIIQMDTGKLSNFYTYLKNLSLNYAVSVEDKIVFTENNSSLIVTMILKPY